VDQVKSKNLQYLSDADISNMYLPNYSDAIAEKLGEINDLVRMEQYLDFTINRTFRCSLICHDDVPINREIGPGNMAKFYLMQIMVLVVLRNPKGLRSNYCMVVLMMIFAKFHTSMP
jgi:hypothetical protein